MICLHVRVENVCARSNIWFVGHGKFLTKRNSMRSKAIIPGEGVCVWCLVRAFITLIESIIEWNIYQQTN